MTDRNRTRAVHLAKVTGVEVPGYYATTWERSPVACRLLDRHGRLTMTRDPGQVTCKACLRTLPKGGQVND